MTPRFGFDAADRILLEYDGIATAAPAAPDDAGPVEIAGQWRLDFTVKPTPRVTWRFEPHDPAPGSAVSDGDVSLRVQLPYAPELELMRFHVHPAAATSLAGILPSYEPQGEVLVADVRFDVVNWGEVLGAIYTRYNKPLQIAGNRHHWSSDGWQIILDGDPGLRQSWDSVKDERGFALTHCGRLTRADGQSFGFSEAHDVLACLHWFLSFVRGRRVGIALASGFEADPGLSPEHEPLITHWGVTHVDEAAAAQGWFTRSMERQLDDLFQSFHRIWRDDEPLTRQLRTMIGTYCVALNHSIPLEMRVLAGYIGLETETTQNLDKSMLKSILADHNLPDLISDTVHGSSQPFSGSKLLSRTRNAIVHHNADNYPTLDQLWKACNTCLYFLELLMLRKLGHDGAFCDRFQATSVGTTSPMPSTPTDD